MPGRVRADRWTWPVAWAVAAGAVIAVEAPHMGSAATLGGASAVLASAMVGALVCVGYAWLADGLAARKGSAPRLRALGWGLVSVLATAPMARTLFDGAFAATLPGARWGHLAVPVLSALAIAVAVWLAAGWKGVWRGAVIGGLIGLAVAAWWANRRFMPRGYPDVHVFLTWVELAAGAVAVRCAWPPGWRGGRGVEVVGASVLGGGLAVGWLGGVASLQAPAARMAIEAHGHEARAMVRGWRGWTDLDGDGASPWWGGGDCAWADAGRHPGAADRPGDAIDQDCDGADASPPPPPPPPVVVAADVAQALAPRRAAIAARHLLFISVDGLRADLVRDGATDFPAMHALLTEGTWFTRAFAPAAGTDLSMASLLTGRWDAFAPIAHTLFERLRAAGRATHVIIPAEVLRYAGDTLLRRGMDQVEVVVTDGAKRDVADHSTARETTDRALAALQRLDAAGTPAIVWAHYFDLHEHAQLPFPTAAAARLTVAGDSPRVRGYRAQARVVDEAIAALRAGLGEVAARTTVVFFSDHGESLQEDPRLPDFHGDVVYQALVDIPFAVVVPDEPARQIAAPVSLLDLHATVLALATGVPASATSVGDAVDWSAAILGAPPVAWPRPRPLVMHEQTQWAVVDWPYKLLVSPARNLVELYDLGADPHERANLAEAEPARVSLMRAQFAQFPPIVLDRTSRGRRARDLRARPPTASNR